MRIHSLVSAIVLFAAAACAPAAYSGSGVQHNSSVITRAEIEQSPAQNVYVIVQRLRPQWLHRAVPQTIGQGDEDVLVYYGATRMGGLDALRDLPSEGIEEIEYLNAAAAQQRFGIGHLNGAIVITPAGG